MPRKFATIRTEHPDYDAQGCRVLMLGGVAKIAHPPIPAAPPKTLTEAEIKVEKTLKGDMWVPRAL